MFTDHPKRYVAWLLLGAAALVGACDKGESKEGERSEKRKERRDKRKKQLSKLKDSCESLCKACVKGADKKSCEDPCKDKAEANAESGCANRVIDLYECYEKTPEICGDNSTAYYRGLEVIAGRTDKCSKEHKEVVECVKQFESFRAQKRASNPRDEARRRDEQRSAATGVRAKSADGSCDKFLRELEDCIGKDTANKVRPKLEEIKDDDARDRQCEEQLEELKKMRDDGMCPGK